MAGNILFLTFHAHLPPKGALIGEDLRCKEFAKSSTLVADDVMDVGTARTFLLDNLAALQHKDKVGPASGLDLVRAKDSTGGNIEIVSLNRVGGTAWLLSAYRRRVKPSRPSIFHEWLGQVFRNPIEALVLAGHHSESHIWGAQDKNKKLDDDAHRWYTALVPKVEGGRSKLEVRCRPVTPPGGYTSTFDPETEPTQIGAGPFDVTDMLRTCKMLLILGCNGATEDAKGWIDLIRNASGANPFVFGFYGVHPFPRNQQKFATPALWTELKRLATTTGTNNLSFLSRATSRDDILRAWFNATRGAFRGTVHNHLYFDPERGGVGAIDTTREIFFVVNDTGVFESQGRVP